NNAVPNSIFFMAIIFVARLTGQLQSHGVAPDVAHADDHCCWNALSRDSERTSSQSVVHSGSRQVPLALSRCARKPILTLSRVDRRLRCGLLGWLLPSRQQEIADEIAFSGRRRFRTFLGILRGIFHVTRATVGLTEQASRLYIARTETKGFLKLHGCFAHST